MKEKTLLAAYNKLLAKIDVVAADSLRTRQTLENWGRMIGSTAGVGPASVASLEPWVVEVSDTAGTFGTPIIMLDGTETPAGFGLPFTPSCITLETIHTINVGQDRLIWYLRISSSRWDGSGHTYANAAAAVAAGNYITIGFEIDDTNYDSYPFVVRSPAIPVGSIVWVEATNNNPGEAGAERQISFLAYGLGFE